MLTFLTGTLLSFAWKFTLATGAITLICFILTAVLGGIATASENTASVVISFLFMTLPAFIMYITGVLFKISAFVTAICFILKLVF